METNAVPNPNGRTRAVPGREIQELTASYAVGRAATELGLKRAELNLAVQLGLVRTTAGQDPGRWRVARSEIERLQAAQGFPETLRARVKLVGTAEGAALMGITRDRFTKLARLGFLTPAKFYFNRYRTLVWLYLADDVRQFAEANAALLSGQAPVTLRTRLGAGEDRRARSWRERHGSHLLRLARTPWQGAAVTASMLDPAQVADLVPDPYERAYLTRLRPESPALPGGPDSPTALAAARVLVADDPDEIRWLRTTLTLALSEARATHPAPRPGAEEPPPTPEPARVAGALTPAAAPHSNTPQGIALRTAVPAHVTALTGGGRDEPREDRGVGNSQEGTELGERPVRRGLLGWISRIRG